ncbi:MAG: hypothetical protein HZB16_04400 [Armatimonadetes bacterium]|nr:hypothetical protein [Armatimonadota bacterium]
MRRVVLALVLWCLPSWAQDGALTINASVTPTECAVGESVTYEAVVTAQSGRVGPFEPTPPDFGGFEAVPVGDPQRVDTPNAALYTYRYRLTPSLTGELLIAPFSVIWQDAADGQRRAEASPRVALRVRPADADDDIRGPKPPVEVPDPLLAWCLGAAGLCLFGLLVAAVRARRRRPPPPLVVVAPEPEPRPSAKAVALARLAELAAAGLPVDGQVDIWHVRLSRIVRAYLQDDFAVQAEVSTTSEIAWRLEDCQVPAGDVALCRRVLYGCDLEKFAAYRPTPEEMTALLEAARALVAALAESAP